MRDLDMVTSFEATAGCGLPSLSARLLSLRCRGGISRVSVLLTCPREWADSRSMGIAVLGPLQVDGHTDALSPRDRVVLSALVVRAA